MWRKLFNRRKHSRFVAAQHTYIVFQHNTGNERILPIAKISEGGCEFFYQGDENDLEKVCFVALMSGNDVYLDRIKISTVSDKPASGSYKQRSVAFRPESRLDKERLKRFIAKVSICKS